MDREGTVIERQQKRGDTNFALTLLNFVTKILHVSSAFEGAASRGAVHKDKNREEGDKREHNVFNFDQIHFNVLKYYEF